MFQGFKNIAQLPARLLILALIPAFLLSLGERLMAHNSFDFDNENEAESGLIQFIPNMGQWEDAIRYKVPMNNGSIFFEESQLTFLHYDGAGLNDFYIYRHGGNTEDLILKSHVYSMQFVGANSVEPQPSKSFQHYYNYFLGKDASKWASRVSAFQELKYANLYAGIDLEFLQSENGHFKYQFRVAPNSDISQIAIRYEGIDKIWLEGEDLFYKTSVHQVKETRLLAFQEIAGERKIVPCAFYLEGNLLKFTIGETYNPNYELLIDPELIFSSFTGSFADNFGFTATYDADGNLYAGGIARSDGYPTSTGAIQDTFAGGIIQGQFLLGFNADISISKFTSDGSQFLYSTYLGGRLNDQPHSLIVNEKDELLIYGRSNSVDYPVTATAYDTTNNGGMDIVVSKINIDGTQLLGSTYIGGSANDGVNLSPAPFFSGSLKYNYADDARGEITLDKDGTVYVAAATQSTDFPILTNANNTIPNTFQGSQEACVFQLSSNLDTLIWSTILSGAGDDAAYSMAFDDSSNLYVCGGTNSVNFPISPTGLDPSYNGAVDGFIMKINSSRDTILNSTFFGTNAYDQCYFIDLDGDNNVYVLGQTEGSISSTPNTYSNPNSGIFILGLTQDLDSVRFQTTIGAGNNLPLISPTAFLVDDVCKSIYLCGWGGASLGSGTISNLPVTPDAFVGTSDGDDFYLMVLSEDAQTLEYATFMGGLIGSRGEHVDGGTSRFDKSGIVYQAVCAGCGASSAFPTTPGVVSNTNNSFNCNLAAFKFNINFLESTVNINTQDGCIPLDIELEVHNPNADYIYWNLGDGTIITDTSHVNHTYTTAGNFKITLISIDSTTCTNTVFIDTVITYVSALNDTVGAALDTNILVSNCDSLLVQFENKSTRASRYLWDFGDGTRSTSANPILQHAYTQSGVFDVELIAFNDSTCNPADTARIKLELKTRFQTEMGLSDSVSCIDLNLQFFNEGTALDSFWWVFSNGFTSSLDTVDMYFNQTGIVDVYLYGLDSASCNILDSTHAQVRIVDDSVKAIFDTILTAAICDSLVLDFDNKSENASSYLWRFSDTTFSTSFEPTKVFQDTGLFQIQLIATNPNTCNAADTAYANAYAKAPVLAAFNAPSACFPFDVQVENTSINATGYQWIFDGQNISTDNTPKIRLENSGSHELELIASNPNTCNLQDRFTLSLNAYGYPTAYFETDTNVYPIFTSISFNNHSKDALRYEWDFGDGNLSELTSPERYYKLEGNYSACLLAENEHACIAEYCKNIELTFRGLVDLPNAFSPNGDGANDILYVKGFGVDYIEFKIYNRWGELVFESSSLENGWDGTYKGKPQEKEVYTYTLKAWFLNGSKSKLRKGNISLLR